MLTITDDTLAVIAEQSPMLEVLHLQRRVDVGPQVTDVGVEVFYFFNVCCWPTSY